MLSRRQSINRDQVYLGLDLSLTGTGVVLIDREGDVIHAATIKNKLRGMERLKFIEGEIEYILRCNATINIAIEGYAMGIRTGQSFSIGELGGVIKLLLYEWKKPFVIVSPTSLKKFVLGKGVGDKDMIIMNVYKRWGFEAKTSDEADALVLAYISRELDRNTGNLPKYQEEVLEVIRNPPVKKKGKKK